MPTPSDLQPRAACGIELTASPRSVFANYAARPADPAPLPAPARGAELPLPLEGLQDSINRAFCRSFVYRFLALGFEDPTPEGWAYLASPVSQHLFERAAAVACRDAGQPAQAAGQAVLSALATTSLESHADAYVLAFGHAARGSCPPNEIEYGDLRADPLFQPHRLADLAAFYRAFGMEVGDDAGERHDHLSIELEFMSVLAAKEAYALENQFDEDALAVCRDAQRLFLREHLGRWTPAFARRLGRMADGTLLGALAAFLHEFLLVECARFGVPSGSQDLRLRAIDEAAESLCGTCGLANSLPGASAASVET